MSTSKVESNLEKEAINKANVEVKADSTTENQTAARGRREKSIVDDFLKLLSSVKFGILLLVL
ncbi:MAG: hypothetical protein JNM06_13945, partial [Blastocatellia bacterium]|nr:hypothetical protein [Blastocatellia bacterium]